MAWQFDVWKTLRGTGGKTAVILIIAGSVGLLSKPWFQRDPAHYFTMRDAAEIVARAGEQELAMVFQLIGDYAPLGEESYTGYDDWHGYFASTNGAFTTNAIDRYTQRRFWSGLENAQDAHFNLTPSSYAHRRWVDLWDVRGVEAYDQGPTINVLQGTGGKVPYAIDVAWWKSNVYDGATWYPFTNANYVTAGDLQAVGRAFTAARWTIEYGQMAGAHFQIGTQRVDKVSVQWTATATNSIDTPFFLVAEEAWAALTNATPEHNYWPEPAYSPADAAAHLPYCMVYKHYARIYMFETGTSDVPRYRRVTLREYVDARVGGAITIGTNCTAYGIGHRIAYQTEAERDEIYHTESGYNPQPYLLLDECEAPSEICREWSGTNVVANAWLHINPISAWDGRFPRAPYTLFARYPFAPPTAISTSTNIYFGWQSVDTNQAFVIDWQFSHLTNREAFYP